MVFTFAGDWHLYYALKLEDKKVYRITFNEITKNAVKESLKNAREINMNGLLPVGNCQPLLFRSVILGTDRLFLTFHAQSEDAEKAAAEFIGTHYGKDYLGGAAAGKKNDRKIQDAHEAIRPTDLNRIRIKRDEGKLAFPAQLSV